MKVLHQLIGVTSLVLVALGFIVGDLAGLVLVTPLVHAMPRWRDGILRAWVGANRDYILTMLRWVGRARLDVRVRVPDREGVLIVSNHQSLLDIPAVFCCVPDGYPVMVAHARYGRGIPLVSRMMRLCGGIFVRPGSTGRAELDSLAEQARGARHPIVIFPEGHRTRDGEIRPWKRAGLEAFLSARAWTVQVVVLDGLWGAARIPDFIRNVATIECRVESAGCFEYDGRDRANHDEFIDRIHRAMCAKLAEIRSAPRSGGVEAKAEKGAARAT